MQSSESQRDVLRTSGSITSVRGTHFSESRSFRNDGGDIYSLVESPQRRRDSHRRSIRVSPSKLPSSVTLSKINQSPENHAHSAHTLRRNTVRRNIHPSNSITSIRSSNIHEHSGRTCSSGFNLGYLPGGNTHDNPYGGQQGQGIISSGSFVSLSSARSQRMQRRKKMGENVDTPEARRSYTVFQRKTFRFKRQERILLLDKQWVHVLPPSTKTLNVMFDTRISVSYHIRLLAVAQIKSDSKSSIVIIGFKKGSKGQLKTYNLKADNQPIAAEIVQALWQLRAQFSGN